MLLSCVEARFDGNSELVAELVTSNGFKAAYAIKDGAEGSRGWVVSTLKLHTCFAFRKNTSCSCKTYCVLQNAEQRPTLDTSKDDV